MKKNLILIVLLMSLSCAYAEVNFAWSGKTTMAYANAKNKKLPWVTGLTDNSSSSTKVEANSMNILALKLEGAASIDVNKSGITKTDLGMIVDSGTWADGKTEFCPYARLNFTWGGSLSFGAMKGAIHKTLSAGNVVGGTGGIDGNWGDFVNKSSTISWQAPGRLSTSPQENGNAKYANQLMFTSPEAKMGDKFTAQVLVSCTPTSSMKGRGASAANSRAFTTAKNLWNVVGLVNYGDNLKFSLALSRADAPSKEKGYQNRVVTIKDLSSWRLGGVWTSGPVSVGAEYFDNKNSGVRASRVEKATAGKGWNIGTAYAWGDHTYSLSFHTSSKKLGLYNPTGLDVAEAGVAAHGTVPAITRHAVNTHMGSASTQVVSLAWDYSIASQDLAGVTFFLEANFVDRKMSEKDINHKLRTMVVYAGDENDAATLQQATVNSLPGKSTNVLLGAKVKF